MSLPFRYDDTHHHFIISIKMVEKKYEKKDYIKAPTTHEHLVLTTDTDVISQSMHNHVNQILRDTCHVCWDAVFCTYFIVIVRWPRDLKFRKHANRKSSSKSRKYLYQFDSRCCNCSQHKQIKKHTANYHNCINYLQCISLFVL